MYPASLLNLLVVIIFIWNLYNFQYIRCLSTDSDSFASSFLIWIPFISFSCLITLARMFTIMLNKSGVSMYHCLVSDLKGKAFSFSQFNVILAVGFSCITFIMLRNFPPFLIFESFYYERAPYFVKHFFFASIEMILWF